MKSRAAWVPAALVLGVAYFLIGRLFPQPSDNLRAWRLGAWLASLVVFAAHIGYEHYWLRSDPRRTALHVAAAVAIGAFGLAFAAMLHSRSTGSAIRPVWLISLVAWPAITAVPAFLVALIAASVLRRLSPSVDSK